MFGLARALNAWRRLALMARLRLKALASRSELEMSLAPGCRIGKGVRISLQGRRNKITLGRGAHLGERVSIELRNGELFLGDRCEIRAESVAHISGRLYLEEACGFSIRCVIHCGQNIEIGKNTIFGEYCSVLDGEHVHTQSDEYHFYLDPRAQNILASVKIGKGVYIGAKATIVRGAEIGDFCRIGANAVVTGKIEPHTLAVGVPARPVKKLV
jgi:acetyltransferase-like isoleucine patch superfamily enzyme